MKKTFVTMLLAIFTLMAAATETSYFRVTLKSANGATSKVRLAEDNDPAITNGFDNGNDTEKMMTQSLPKSVLLYGIVGVYNCEDVVATSLDNLYLGFVSNTTDTEYTLLFDQMTDGSRTFVLYDLVENELVTISNTTPAYSFSAVAGRVAVNDRFIINPTFTVTTNVNGWATYSNSLDLVAEAAPAGVTEPIIYSAEYDGAETLALTAQDGVKANTGVVVWGDPSTTYTLVPGTVTTYTSGLTASVAETTVDAAKTNYCLATISGVSAFYEYTGAKVSANKAYLEVGGTAAPKRIRMVVNGTTDVENVEAEVTTEKVYQNGQLLIKKGEQLYNLQGQIVK